LPNRTSNPYRKLIDGGAEWLSKKL
jgi:hypothetical protein